MKSNTPLHVLTDPNNLSIALYLHRWGHLYHTTISEDLHICPAPAYHHLRQMTNYGLLSREHRTVNHHIFTFYWITPLCEELLTKHNLLEEISLQLPRMISP